MTRSSSSPTTAGGAGSRSRPDEKARQRAPKDHDDLVRAPAQRASRRPSPSAMSPKPRTSSSSAATDIRLTLAAAETLRVPMPLASLLRDRFLTLLAHGGEALDWSAIGQLAANDAGLGDPSK